MKKGLTEIVFILDRSGSMCGLEADTIGGFNSMLDQQKQQEGEAYISTVLFDHETQVLQDRLPLDRVPPMTKEEYFVRGNTALLDAVGGSIRHIENIHKYARPEDVPERTMFVITTDGMENASRNFTCEQVKEMIENKRKSCGWEFLFLGANIDAVQTARHLGIGADFAANYHADAVGTQLNYAAVASAVSAVRSGAKLKANWKADIDQDFAERNGER